MRGLVCRISCCTVFRSFLFAISNVEKEWRESCQVMCFTTPARFAAGRMWFSSTASGHNGCLPCMRDEAKIQSFVSGIRRLPPPACEIGQHLVVERQYLFRLPRLPRPELLVPDRLSDVERLLLQSTSRHSSARISPRRMPVGTSSR